MATTKSSSTPSTTPQSPAAGKTPLQTPDAIPLQPKPAGMRPPVPRPAPKTIGSPVKAAAALGANLLPPSALGQGINTFFNEGVGTAIDVGTPVTHGGSQTVNYSICQSIEDVYQAINVAAAVSLDDLAYAMDAKANLVAQMNISSTSVTIAIYANVITGTQAITSPSFKSGIDTSNPATFFATYGDSFVSSITTGAEYIALYTFYATTVSEQLQLAASIKATAPTWSAMTQANLQSIVNSATCMYSMQQIIIGATGLQTPDANSMITFANSFGTTTPNVAEILSYTVSAYENVASPPWSTTSPVVTNRNAFLTAASQLNTLTETNNAFIDLQQLYNVYGYTDASLASPLSTLTTDLQNAVSWVNTLGANPTQTVAVPTFQTLSNPKPLPAPNFSLQSSSMFGSVSALNSVVNPLSFPPPSPTAFQGLSQNQIAAGVAPVSITLYNDTAGANNNICTGISISYSDGSQLAQGGGNAAGTLQLQAAEVVTSMTGQQVLGVSLLTLSTNNQNSVTGGSNTGSPGFSWTASSSQVFVGVTGQTVGSGSGWLAGVAVQYVAFAPANWMPLP